MDNTVIIPGAVGGNSHEIKQVKWLSFKPTKVVKNGDNVEYSDKIDTDDEIQNAFRLNDKFDKEALVIIEILAVINRKLWTWL